MKLIEHQNVLCLYDVYENRKYLVSKDWIYNANKASKKALQQKHPSDSTMYYNKIFPQKYSTDNTKYFNKNIQVTIQSITTQYFHKNIQWTIQNISTKTSKSHYEVLQHNTKYFNKNIQVKYYNKIFQQKLSPNNTTYFNKDIQVTTQNISVPGAWTRVWGRALRLPREEGTTHTQSKIWRWCKKW